MQDVRPVTIQATAVVPLVAVPGVGLLPQVRWEAESARVWDHEIALNRLAPEYLRAGWRFARPALPCGALVAPIIAWWALLLALSSIARYEPAPWREALNVDESPLAVPLERLLAQATISIPYLVLRELSDETLVLPDLP